MKMKLKNFDDAYEAAKQFNVVGAKSIFGLFDDTIPWGEYVEVKFDEECGDTRYYTYNGYYIPHFCFEKEIMLTAENVMRYGDIIEDTEIRGEYSHYRIKIVTYDGEVYYIKMQDGEVVNFTRIGKEL